jgi:starch phosphorylase
MADAMSGEGHGRAKALAAWKKRVIDGWADVAVVDVASDAQAIDLGHDRAVSADVALGSLGPGDVDVQLVHGPVGPTDELTDTSIVSMTLREELPGTGRYCYDGVFTCDRAGRYGFTVRIVPAHPDLTTFAELGRVAWALHTAPTP